MHGKVHTVWKNSGTNEVTKPIQEAQAGHQVKKMPFPLYTQSESIADRPNKKRYQMPQEWRRCA